MTSTLIDMGVASALDTSPARRRAAWAEPEQIDLEEVIAAGGTGDGLAPAPLHHPDAPTVTAAGVSAPKGRTVETALAAETPTGRHPS